MSYVTSLILFLPLLEDQEAKIKEVNAFFEKRAHPGETPFVGLNDQPLPPGWYGGTKWLQANLYVGAFNYLDLDALMRHLGTVQWEDPENVQLFIKDEHDDKFRLAYGVQEKDPVIRQRDDLLFEAQDWLEDLEKLVPANSYEAGQLKVWQERYRQLLGEEKDSEA